MDLCSFADFRDALRNLPGSFRTLHDIECDVDSITTTKHFAECRATFHGHDVMLYAPLTLQAMTFAKRSSVLLATAEGVLGSLSIYPEELLCRGLRSYYCSIVIEPCSGAVTLREALCTYTYSHLMQGLNLLREQLRHYGISHNHLFVDNILIDRGNVWHPLRGYYSTAGVGGDKAAFEHIAQLIAEHALPDVELHDRLSSYSTQSATATLRHPLIERRRRVTTPRGVGFEDENGRMVIEDIYLSASDFSEDRARVVTHDHKVGLIDKRGCAVIEPIYDDVEYDTDDGSSLVRLGDRYARFDYLGERLSDWHK